VITLSDSKLLEDVAGPHLIVEDSSETVAVGTDAELEALVFGTGRGNGGLGTDLDRVSNEADMGAEDFATAARIKRKPWSRIVSGLFFVAMFAGLYANRSLATDVWGELHRISIRSMFWLALLLGAHKISHGLLHAASVPGLRFRRAVVATEAYVGASNSVVGGAGIGTALRVAMYRSWGVSSEGVALSLWATALAPSFAMWTLAGAQTLPRFVLSGTGTNAEKFSAVASVVFLTVAGVFWTLALRSPKPFRKIAQVVNELRTKAFAVASGSLADTLRSSKAGTFDVLVSMESLRCRAATLSKRRRVVLFLAALAGQFLMATTLLACVRALGVPSSEVDAFAVYRSFAMLRVLSSFLPIPGGLGVLDVGLLGVLTAGGVHRPTAIAALALYRGLTFVLPMFTGSVCAALWRTSSSCAEHRLARRRVHETTQAMIDPAVA
jgi:uncharacterized membrane protein YbhN (UPF0104 family)